MASAYTVLLGRARGFANSDIVIATIGSAQAVIVRDLVAMNVGETAESVHFYVRAGGENFHLAVLPFESGESVHLELRQRLGAGDELHVYSASSDWNASVTGYLLGLEPS